LSKSTARLLSCRANRITMNEFDNLDKNEFLKTGSGYFKIGYPKAVLVASIIAVSFVVAGVVINYPVRFWKGFYHFSLPLSYLAGGLLAIFAVLPYLKTKWKSVAEHIKTKTGLGIVLSAVLLYFFALPLAEYLMSLFPTTGNRFIEELYDSTKQAFETMLNYKIAGFITVCIIAPVFEEILFRGILLRGLLQNNKNPFLAILLSSFLFGLAHMNPWQFLGAGLLGAVFGFVYYRTKSLWLCIFLHALNNTISFLMMVKYGTLEENVTGSNEWYIVFGGLLLAALTGWGIFRLTKNKAIWN